MADQKTCVLPDCGRKFMARGWCARHYNRWLLHGSPLGGRPSPGAHQAWLQQNAAYEGDDCLIWPFPRGERGYGGVVWGGVKMFPSRAMCMIAHGTPPTASHHAAHTCGKGSCGCVNPNHLRWATAVENAADKALHLTELRGQNANTGKLSDDQVLDLCARYDGGVTQVELARIFQVTQAQVSNIVRGNHWGWLTGRGANNNG